MSHPILPLTLSQSRYFERKIRRYSGENSSQKVELILNENQNQTNLNRFGKPLVVGDRAAIFVSMNRQNSFTIVFQGKRLKTSTEAFQSSKLVNKI